MDLPALALDIVRDAKKKYESIPAIHYALENFTLVLPKDIIQEHLVKCEYSKKAQFIALALIHEEGDSKNLFKNMDLSQLHIEEVEFLDISLTPIQSLCKDGLYIPDNLQFATFLYLATYLQSNQGFITKMFIASEQTMKMTIPEMIQLAILPTIDQCIFSNLVTKIFINKDFPKYVQGYLRQEREWLPGEECSDLNNSPAYINFKRFIGRISTQLKVKESEE